MIDTSLQYLPAKKRLPTFFSLILLVLATWVPTTWAQDELPTLVLDLQMEDDLLSLSHNIENFLFAPTENRSPPDDRVINDIAGHDRLKGRLLASALVRYQGKVVGLATEQEYFIEDGSGKPLAHSMWLIYLNAPELAGFMVVDQYETGGDVFNIVSQVLEDPSRTWPDETTMHLSTQGEAKIVHTSGDLAAYKDATFKEYNGLNPADFKNLGRFRGHIRFVIEP